MKAVVLLGLLGFALGAMDCIDYTCGSLSDGVCASLSADGETITINEDGCPDDEVCSLTAALVTFSLSSATTYECVEVDDDDSDDVDDSDYEDFSGDDWKDSSLCNADSGKNLKEGSWADECDSDSDCELSDGTFADCECHLDGNAYCTPSLKSDYFEEWHQLCEDGDANEVYYAYFSTKLDLYGFVENLGSDLDCLSDVTVEHMAYDEIESDYEDEEDSASSLVLGSLLALLVLA